MNLRTQTGFAGRFYVVLLFVVALVFGQVLTVAHAHPAEISGSISTEISDAHTHQHADHNHAHQDDHAPEQTACAVCLAITSEDELSALAELSPPIDVAFAAEIASDFPAFHDHPLTPTPQGRASTDRHLAIVTDGVRAPPATA